VNPEGKDKEKGSQAPGQPAEGGPPTLGSVLPQRGTLHRFIRRLLHGSADADDIVQDAYLRLLERASHEREVTSLPGYLFVIARNLATDRGRRAQREGKRAAALRALNAQLGNAVPGVDELVHVAQATERLRVALRALPVRARKAFLLHRVEGLNHDEVAARLGVTRRTVERDIAFVLGQLKKVLFPSEEA
jgi:RNA polymerase sigma-70 factor (ECF subfamily)